LVTATTDITASIAPGYFPLPNLDFMGPALNWRLRLNSGHYKMQGL